MASLTAWGCVLFASQVFISLGMLNIEMMAKATMAEGL